MNQLLHRPAEAIQKELQDEGLIFRNPASAEWEISDKYLTGNVRGKLHIAQAAAEEDPQYRANVEALTAAMLKGLFHMFPVSFIQRLQLWQTS